MEHSARFWNPARTRRVIHCLCAALILTAILGLLIDKDSSSMLKRGDFPGFYAPAVILARGMNERLYDFELQRQIENEFWPSMKGEFYIYAYPPYTAMALRPLAFLPPLTAQLLATVGLFFSFVAALFLIAAHAPLVRRSVYACAVCMLCFAPFFDAVFAAQNTAISMLLYAGGIALLLRNRDAAAGMVLGLWMYKPQFGVLALLFPLLAGRWRLLLGALVPFVLYSFLGFLASGIEWPWVWLESVARFTALNKVTNEAEMISLLPLCRAAVRALGGGAITGTILGAGASVLVFGITARRFFSARGSSERLEHALFLLGPALVLISPQALYYELGIPLLASLRYLKLDTDRAVFKLAALLAAAFALTYFRHLTPVPVLSLFSIGAFLFVARQGWLHGA